MRVHAPTGPRPFAYTTPPAARHTPRAAQVMDEGCSYPIQQGAKLSRARVFTFKHNDADDLAALLARIEAEERRERWGCLCVCVFVDVCVCVCLLMCVCVCV